MSGTDFIRVLDQDVLHVLYGQYMAVPELQALRLVNRLSESVAACYLFRTIIIRPRKSTLDVIANIAGNQVFARGVREVIWETGHYIDTLAEPPGHFGHGRDAAKGLMPDFLFRFAQSVGHRILSRPSKVLHDNREDDRPLLDQPRTVMDDTSDRLLWEEEVARPELTDALTAAFRRFTGLTKACIYSWARSYDGLTRSWEWYMRRYQRVRRTRFGLKSAARNAQALDPIDGQYGPLPIFLNRWKEDERQARALLVLLQACSAAGHSLEELRIRPCEEPVDREIYRRSRGGHFDKLGLHMNIAVHDLSRSLLDQTTLPLRRLTKLHLQLKGDSAELPDSLRASSLRRILVHALNLEDLQLSVDTVSVIIYPLDTPTIVYRRLVRLPLETIIPQRHTFPRLRRLALDSICMSGAELCDLVRRHYTTLELLALSSIVLGCDEESIAKFDRQCFVWYERYSSDYDATPVGPLIQDCDPTDQEFSERGQQLAEWSDVVEACQRLPNLGGIRIEMPMMWTGLPTYLCEAPELEVRAMDGRRNCLRE